MRAGRSTGNRILLYTTLCLLALTAFLGWRTYQYSLLLEKVLFESYQLAINECSASFDSLAAALGNRRSPEMSTEAGRTVIDAVSEVHVVLLRMGNLSSYVRQRPDSSIIRDYASFLSSFLSYSEGVQELEDIESMALMLRDAAASMLHIRALSSSSAIDWRVSRIFETMETQFSGIKRNPSSGELMGSGLTF